MVANRISAGGPFRAVTGLVEIFRNFGLFRRVGWVESRKIDPWTTLGPLNTSAATTISDTICTSQIRSTQTAR
jgi:hypothetical protein